MRGATRRGRAVVAAVSVGWWGCAGSAFAQIPQDGGAGDANPAPESTRAPEAARTVDVTVVAGGDDTDALMGTIRELLGRLGLGIEPHVVAAGSPAVAPGEPGPGLSAWIDLASRYEAVTIVRRGRTEVRRTIPRDSSPAIVREEIGEAVRSGVEAQLLVDATASAPPPPVAALPPPAPVVHEAPPPAAGSTRWFALESHDPRRRRIHLERLGTGPARRRRRGLRVEAASPAVAHRDGRVLCSLRRGYALGRHGARVPRFGARRAGNRDRTRLVARRERRSGGRRRHHLRQSVPLEATRRSRRAGSVPDRVDPILTTEASLYLAFAPSVAFTLVAGADVDFVPPVYAIGSPLRRGRPEPLARPSGGARRLHVHGNRPRAVRREDAVKRAGVFAAVCLAAALVGIAFACGSNPITIATIVTDAGRARCEYSDAGDGGETCPDRPVLLEKRRASRRTACARVIDSDGCAGLWTRVRLQSRSTTSTGACDRRPKLSFAGQGQCGGQMLVPPIPCGPDLESVPGRQCVLRSYHPGPPFR